MVGDQALERVGVVSVVVVGRQEGGDVLGEYTTAELGFLKSIHLKKIVRFSSFEFVYIFIGLNISELENRAKNETKSLALKGM